MAKDAPLGSEIPIDTIVVLMMENRSFDHLLRQPARRSASPTPRSRRAGATNPDTDGTPVPRFHLDRVLLRRHQPRLDRRRTPSGTTARWTASSSPTTTTTARPPTASARWATTPSSDMPFLYALANTFALADHNFSSVLGPTFPNREYLYAATSFGHTGNDLVHRRDTRPSSRTLDRRPRSTGASTTPTCRALGIFLGTLAKYLDNTYTVSQLLRRRGGGHARPASTSSIPSSATSAAGRNDFHPPGDVQVGEKFLERRSSGAHAVAAVAARGAHRHLRRARRHLRPRGAAAGVRARRHRADARRGDAPGDFASYGVRVPLIVVSPYAKPHFVSHAVYDHTSIMRFIETRFRLPRADRARRQRRSAARPVRLQEGRRSPRRRRCRRPTVDPQKLADCIQRYPDDGGVGFSGHGPAAVTRAPTRSRR